MKIFIYIMSFVFVGIPVLVLTAAQTGNDTAAPAVAGLAAAYFVARLIIKKYIQKTKS